MDNTQPHLVSMATSSPGKSTDKAKRTLVSARNTSHRHPLPTCVFLVWQQKTPAAYTTLGWSLRFPVLSPQSPCHRLWCLSIK